MDKKLILYGSGQLGTAWLEQLGAENVYAFADSDEKKIGVRIVGKGIVSVNELIQIRDEIKIFISTGYTYKSEIYQKLKTVGLHECVVGIPYFGKNIYANWNTQVDINTVFEGRNSLSEGVKLHVCKLGFASYIAQNTVLFNTKIGRYTSIGPNVRIIYGQHPTKKFVSTHPIFYSTQQIINKSYVAHNLFDEFRYTTNGYVVEIGNDVWIGDGATIMEGVRIADGTVIAAGANVVKDTEPYSIVGGNPAKLLRYRFEIKDIQFLQELQWWNKTESWIDEHAVYFDDITRLKNYIKNKEKGISNEKG